MDSGDARGDAYFGLSQLVLPQLCALEPSFLWCANRQYLSDGAAHMVYTEFVVESRPAFGDYQACNPDPTTGVFQCESEGPSAGAGTPTQCQAAGLMPFTDDCMNGTVYSRLDATDEGECCAACSADGAKCAGYAMPRANGSECLLLGNPLVMWSGELAAQGCAAGFHFTQGGGGFSDPCWYSDPRYNTTAAFVAACDKASCTCEAISKMALGREQSAMCWHHSKPKPNDTATATATAPTAAVAHGSAEPPEFWTCSEAVYDVCFDQLEDRDHPSLCAECALANRSTLATRGCSSVPAAQRVCSNNNITCDATLRSLCPGLTTGKQSDTLACQACAWMHADALAQANCTSWLVNEVCYDDDDEHENKWEQYMDDLACLMDGTWFSTDAAGECKPGGTTDDCWWRIAEVKRTVNQSCVDDRVVQAVKQARGPGCWDACPAAQRTNVSSACWISCFFDTMLGTGYSKKHGPMEAEDIAKAFAGAFLEEGGCASVVPPTVAAADGLEAAQADDPALRDWVPRSNPWRGRGKW